MQAQTRESNFSLLDNLKEKLSHQDLAPPLTFGTPRHKFVPIVAGAGALLNYLASDSRFRKDRIWSRLAHTHPLSIIAYREKASPSLHVVFLELPDGSLKADMHLDGNGPQQLFPHLDEFLFHKLTFQDNNQNRMNANLKRSFARDAQVPEAVFFSRRERTLLFLHETFGIKPIAAAAGNALFRHFAHELVWKSESRYEPILNRLEGALFRNTLRNGIEFGVANWRQEDTRYRGSGLAGVTTRLQYALVRAFIVPTPAGTEFAYARFAGLVGTAVVTDAWHPWRQYSYPPNYYRRAAFGIVLGPIARSLWTEFGSDMKRRFRLRD